MINHASTSGEFAIVIPQMGEGNMPDFPEIKEGLEKAGFEVLNPNLQTLSETLNNHQFFSEIPWDRVKAVPLDNMRGSLTNYSEYRRIIRAIEKRNNGQFVIFPSIDAIDWIAGKRNYLEMLKATGIPIIPTSMIELDSAAGEKKEYEVIDSAARQVIGIMKSSIVTKFVLKPSTSALAKGLVSLHKLEGSNYKVEVPVEAGCAQTETIYSSEASFFEDYLKNYFYSSLHDHNCFLLQQFIENEEVSAVFVNGSPHYIGRLPGKESNVAHARYGGKDYVIQDPELALVQFVKRVAAVLPTCVQSSPYFRIDVMQDKLTKNFLLSEIEGAGGIRLWLKSAGRVDDYVSMIEGLVS